jgi:uncharacterized protein
MINEVFASCRSGDRERLQQLLELDPTLANTENSDGLTPLGFASHYGQAEAVQVLLEFGADVNALSHSSIPYIPSNTALHAAIAGERNVEVIQLLLNHEANTNVFDSNGHTSLHAAAFHDDNVELIKLLLGRGADPRAKVEGGTEAASLAMERGNHRVAELLQGWEPQA